MGQLLNRLRRVPDRLLHPRRRRAVVASLVARPRPGRILLVCNGNIFRSPFAAALLQRAVGSRGVQVDSAGFLTPGRPSPPDARAAATRFDVDLASHRSRLLTETVVQWADLIVVMDGVQRRVVCERFGRPLRDVVILGDLDPEPIASRGIEDPVKQSVAVCERVYARVKRCVAELVKVLYGDGQRAVTT